LDIQENTLQEINQKNNADEVREIINTEEKIKDNVSNKSSFNNEVIQGIGKKTHTNHSILSVNTDYSKLTYKILVNHT